jgi:D-glycero-D-manno-heptose 1,7-bisphosphate phosphatase
VRAAGDLGLDREQSWMIGDEQSDVEAGRAAGCATILIGGDEPDLLSASDRLC